MSPRLRRTAPLPEPADTRAVVVGVEEYAAGADWSLDGPALDACRFTAWLTSHGVPAERVSLLLSPLPKNAAAVAELAGEVPVRPADSATVRAVLTGLRQQSSGLLVVYWGGHGVLEEEQRRLLYADATGTDRRNLNLTQLLSSLRSSTYTSHPRQLVMVDACATPVDQRLDRMPDERLPEGRAELWREQWVLTAASPGERALNDDALGTGLFSAVLREELERAPVRWPPDAEGLRDAVRERFEELRDAGRTKQMPSHLWYRSRVAEQNLVFANVPGATDRTSGGELLNHAEFKELRSILNGAPAPAALPALFRDATRDVSNCPHPAFPDDLLSTVRALRAPVSPRPLFHFLVRMAAGSDRVTQDRLWEWINEVAPRWGVEPAELHELDGQLRRTHIAFRLQPDLLGDGFEVTGWTFDAADAHQETCTDGDPWDLRRVAAELSEVICDYAADLDTVPPVVEFLLPLALLDEDVETLPVLVAERACPVGELCPVVIRPLERLGDERAREGLRTRWKDLTARGDGYAEDAIHWVLDGAAHGVTGRAAGSAEADTAAYDACGAASSGAQGSVLADGGQVCAALAYARSHGPADDPALRAVLDAGMPVALWHRHSPARQDRRAALQAVLGGRGLRDLPDVVREQRNAARHPHATAEHAGNGLVLLWDDPDRLPPDLRWHPPVLYGAAP
ncbi:MULTISPECIES: VMAP-C domain-containing protein [unclassified Streptomyces]|uniref:VMAP-C domain-containing protein n=1 Tax=unclassified Streptomyces TaxID=2593676 RepID=UPI00404326EE